MMCGCFNYLLDCIVLELNACWELKVLKIIIIIIKMTTDKFQWSSQSRAD